MLARELAVAGVCMSVCVCHTLVFYRNGWTDRVDFLHGSFFRPISHFYEERLVSPEIRTLPSETLCPKLRTRQNTSLRHIDRRNVLSTELHEDGRSERDKLDRRRPA